MGQVFAVLILMFISIRSQAEYRVFQLLIYKKPPAARTPSSDAKAGTNSAIPPSASNAASSANAQDPAADPTKKPALPSGKVVLSTLDPLQYKTYYPIGDDMNIVYTDTWRCRGRTDGLDLCPNPKPIQPKK